MGKDRLAMSPRGGRSTAFQRCECQIVRSVARWSLGVEPETSVQQAYHALIDKAQHYVYIENQFFCTRTTAEPGK
jgi:phosphatidylserine/phosphatidylglycerophosphate/cardiolipin synthase-like enzyme